ncbi:hypothetical protein LLG95_17970 [bacterium]|nr:hypothetical protein [bacterium]
MEEKQPLRRWKKWALIAALVLLAIPLIAIVVFKITFHANAIRADQLQPPTAYLSLHPKLRALPTSPKQIPSASYEDFVAASPNKQAAAFYKKWATRFESDRAWQDANLYSKISDRPLTPVQTKWLVENHELIHDLIKLANAGGLPSMSYEQAATYKDVIARMPTLNFIFIQTCSKILAAESCRLRRAGQPAEAADALLAIRTLARSVREPVPAHFMLACAMQRIADVELTHWLAESAPPPEIACRLSDSLTSDTATITHLRRVMELEYLIGREFLVEFLNKPYPELETWLLRNMGYTNNPHSSRDIWYYVDNPKQSFLELMNRAAMRATAAAGAAKIKSSAASALKEFDAEYISGFMRMGRVPGDPVAKLQRAPRSDSWIVRSLTPYFDEMIARTRAGEALANLDLAALDRILNPTAPPQTLRADPFATAPLRSIAESTTTLIYSIGPDLKDDRAALPYDPTNGTLTPGDIILRLPR